MLIVVTHSLELAALFQRRLELDEGRLKEAPRPMNAFAFHPRKPQNSRRRVHIAVALGVMTATAVLTGALVVGDSMRGSLRHLALDRLQGIDDALVVPRFFRAELADELAASHDPLHPEAKSRRQAGDSAASDAGA